MIGRILNKRYKITDLLGKGAMGTVYRAIDTLTRQEVALKIIASELAIDPTMLERFKREGETLQQLNHPNVVRFVDAFRWSGPGYSDNSISAVMRRLFIRPATKPSQSKKPVATDEYYVIVMEYIHGGSLYELIKSGPLSIERTRQIGLDLCDALIRAHRLNIIHRDIKPENILLDEDGTPKLADFGVARITAGTRMTRTGTQVGTPYYMAPEAWEGKILDAQADIWSLGVVLYEMLSGQVPFDGDTGAVVMTKVLTTQPPDLNNLRANVPSGLVKIITHMLTREKEERYRTMREVAVNLERVQLPAEENLEFAGRATRIIPDHETTEKIAQEKAAHEKARLEVEEQARQIAAREKAERELAEKISREKSEKEAAEKAKHESTEMPKRNEVKPKPVEEKAVGETSQVASKEIHAQSSQRKSGTQNIFWVIGIIAIIVVIGLSSLNKRLAFPPIPTSTRTVLSETSVVISETKTFVPNATLTKTPVRNLTPTSVAQAELNFNLVFISEQDKKPNLYYLTSEGEKKNLYEGSDFSYVTYPVLSPNGKLIAFGTEKGIYSVDIYSGVLERLSSFGVNPAWSPDGLEIAFETGDLNNTPYHSNYDCNYDYSRCTPTTTDYLSNQNIYLITLANETPTVGRYPLIGYRGTILPAWNNNGSKFAFVKRQNVDFLCAITDLQWYGNDNCIQVRNYVETFAWHPKEDKIIFSATRNGNTDIYLFDAKDLSQTNLTGGVYSNYSPIWDHSGTRIAFVSNRDGNNEIYIMNVTDLSFENITQNSSNDFSPVWSPDDKKIIFVSDRSGNLDIFSIDVSNGETVNLTNDPSDEFSPSLVSFESDFVTPINPFTTIPTSTPVAPTRLPPTSTPITPTP